MILFDSLEDIVLHTAEGARPPERLTVSEASAKYRHLNNVGAYVGPWLNETTPYLVDFMDVLTSEEYIGGIMVAPAQSGKTDCSLNWLLHTVVTDPVDFMIIEKTQAAARDFSMRRLDRLHEYSTAVGERVAPGRDNENTFDRRYSSGMLLTLTWPTKNNLSGKPVPRMWLSDFDRMDQDVDGEGNAFDLARRRATTFRNFGMTVAESSPSFPIENSRWVPKTKHEAPPTQGILALYNTGDRRRWYWRCVSCHNSFEPDFKLMRWPKTEDIMEASEASYLQCPHCESKYRQDEGKMPGKHQMNRHGKWVKDGMFWTTENQIVGDSFRSDIASFWLKGAAAAFVDFGSMVGDYLKAEQIYEQTGDEESLKTTVNTTQGTPYVPKSEASARLPEELKNRAKPLGIREVPPGVRFLIATIDLQKSRFVVQVHGIGTNENGLPDYWIVDRFNIRKSRRIDEDGDRHWVNLGANPEDWKQLTDEVLTKTYPLGDGSGRRMAIKQTLCDSAGLEGFTENAYNFVRWLRRGPDDESMDDDDDDTYFWEPGLSMRFQLLRGDPNHKAPRVRMTYPDSQRKDRHAGARGEIPVLATNVNMLKNAIDKMLDRKVPGGRVNFPDWLDDNFYTELTVEVNDPKKGWINPKNYRNESWDLLVYCKAATLHQNINLENLDWTNPPIWAAPWDDNALVFDPEIVNKPFDVRRKSRHNLAQLADNLA